jgi:hypothetical protein
MLAGKQIDRWTDRQMGRWADGLMGLWIEKKPTKIQARHITKNESEGAV